MSLQAIGSTPPRKCLACCLCAHICHCTVLPCHLLTNKQLKSTHEGEKQPEIRGSDGTCQCTKLQVYVRK